MKTGRFCTPIVHQTPVLLGKTLLTLCLRSKRSEVRILSGVPLKPHQTKHFPQKAKSHSNGLDGHLCSIRCHCPFLVVHSFPSCGWNRETFPSRSQILISS